MAFDPDTYLASQPATTSVAAGFNPDQYLATPSGDAPQPGGGGWGAAGSFGGALGKIGQTADDAVRAAANAVTFGMADRIAGWMPGSTVDEEVKKSEQARERSPIASVAGDVAGSIAIPGAGGARLATNLGTRFGGGAARQFGARALGYGAEGAGIGALQGAGNTYTGNAEDYAKNALIGGGIGGAAGGLMGGILSPRGPVSSAALPTIPEQQRATNRAYDLLRTNPTQYDTAAFNRTAQDLEANLYKRFDPAGDSAPASFRAVNRMQSTDAVTPKSIEDIRIGLNEINPLAKTDRKAAYQVKNALDDFLANPPPGAVAPAQMQTAQEAARLAELARASNAGLRRSQLVENARTSLENKTARANSGLNAENNMRAWADRMVSPNEEGIVRARVRGFNTPEIEAMNNVLHPGRPDEALRYVANYFGGGGGLGALVATGGGALAGGLRGGDQSSATFGGTTALAGGLALRALANRRANARMQTLQDLVAQRNPLYQQRAATAPMVPGPTPLGPRVADNTQNIRDAITYQLLQRQPAESLQ